MPNGCLVVYSKIEPIQWTHLMIFRILYLYIYINGNLYNMVLGNQWKINIKHSFVGIKNQLIHVFRNAYLFSRFVTQLFLIIL